MELGLREIKATLKVQGCSPENGLLQEPGTSPESSSVFLTCPLCTKSTMIESAKEAPTRARKWLVPPSSSQINLFTLRVTKPQHTDRYAMQTWRLSPQNSVCTLLKWHLGQD